MTDTLFTPVPVEGEPVTMPNGVTVHAREVSDVPSEGKAVLCLGIEWDDMTPRGPLYGIVTVDELGTITNTHDGVLTCPYSVGDAL